MTAVFFTDGNRIATREIQSVPRVGEGLWLNDVFRNIIRVVWEFDKAEVWIYVG